MMSWSITPIVLFLSLIYLLYRYITRNNLYWIQRNLPGPKPFPFLGNAWDIISFKESLATWLRNLYVSTDEPFLGIFVFDDPILLIRSPDIAKHILIRDFNHFHDRAAASPKHNEHFSYLTFFQKNPQWKQMRTKLTPIFTSSKIRNMFQTIRGVTKEMTEYLNRNAIGDTKSISLLLSTEVITRCFFGLRAKCFENEETEIKKMCFELFRPTLRNLFSQSMYFLKPNVVDLLKLEFFSTTVQDYFYNAFFDTIKKIEDGKMNSNNFVGMLNDLRKVDPSFDGKRMTAQSLTVYSAGTETTSSTIAFALYELSRNPDIQNRLREEILEVIAKHHDFTYESLQEMKYLGMVVSETLRKYPVLSLVDRICTKDYKIPGTDVVIEKGTPILISILGIQSDPEYYPDPKKFDPERFCDKLRKENCRYLPFGLGQRMCIGYRFALMNIQITIVEILRNFEIKQTDETPHDIEFQPAVTLQSKAPLLMKFKPIEYKNSN